MLPAVKEVHRLRGDHEHGLEPGVRPRIGGGVPAIIETTRAAGRILAIDGCPQDCARKSLEKAGFSDFLHLQLADLGLSKGQSSVNPERVDFVVQKATDLLK